MTRPSLTELHAFAAIATHGSFRKAADILGTAPSSLSHMMKALENKIGARLLHRTTRSVSLTETGAQFIERIRPLLDDFDLAIDELGQRQGRPTGTLRLNVTTGVALQLIERVLPGFLAEHSGIEVDLVSEGELVDIVAAGFDAGIRLGLFVPRDMHAVPFGAPARFVPVATPGYLKGRTPPATPWDLHLHECIRSRMPSGKRYQWEFMHRDRLLALDVPGRLTLDEPTLILRAALQGLGIAYVFEQDARPYIESGELIVLLEAWCIGEPGLQVYYPGHRHVPPALRAFLDFIKRTGPL